MKANERKLLIQCVETGVALGMRRVFKHNDHPSREQLEAAIADGVIGEIDEWFRFDTDAHSTDISNQ